MCMCAQIHMQIYVYAYTIHRCVQTYTYVLFSTLLKWGLGQTSLGVGRWLKGNMQIASPAGWPQEQLLHDSHSKWCFSFHPDKKSESESCTSLESKDPHSHTPPLHPGRTAPNFSHILGSKEWDYATSWQPLAWINSLLEKTPPSLYFLAFICKSTWQRRKSMGFGVRRTWDQFLHLPHPSYKTLGKLLISLICKTGIKKWQFSWLVIRQIDR